MCFDKEKLAEALSLIVCKSLYDMGENAKKLPWFSSSASFEASELDKVTDN